MKTLLPLLAGLWMLLAGPLVVDAKVERTVEKSFTVQPGGTVKVATSGGNIRVEPGAADTVKVVALEKIRADNDAEATELLKDLELTIEQNGNDITAVAKYNRGAGSWFHGSWPPVQVSFTITVPAHFNAELKTSGGNIGVGDLAGRIEARTSGGDVKVGTIDGAVDAGTSGGNVTLVACTGDTKLHTSGGDVHADKIAGKADLNTSGGNVSVGLVENVLSAHTSGGNVRAAIGGSLKGDCTLETSGGDVEVKVDKTAAFLLDAGTSGGRVRADGITITLGSGETGHSHLSGKVNGGGPLLKLRTSGGDIRVETN
jgi:hypothetical protein